MSRKFDGTEWWGLCPNPSESTWASLPLREITFSSLSPEPLSSLDKCLRDLVNHRRLRLDCYTKCLHSFLICCRLSHQASVISRCFSTFYNQPWLYLHCVLRTPRKLSAFLFAVDSQCSTTDDAWWTVKLCHLSLKALAGRQNTPPREHFIISQILSEQIPNIWGTTMN